MDKNCIAKHIRRYEETGNEDSLWRIASHCDLFANLNPNGTLTPDQKEYVLEFIKGAKWGLKFYGN